MRNSAFEIIRELTGDNATPEDAFERFFSWYEDYWLMNDDLVGTLDTMPRPLREVVVTHQAFGYMSSEAPSGYYDRFDSVFDDEVELGMVELGFSDSATVLAEGRSLAGASDDADMSIEQDYDVYGKLPSLEDLEDRIGHWLIERASQS